MVCFILQGAYKFVNIVAGAEIVCILKELRITNLGHQKGPQIFAGKINRYTAQSLEPQ